MKLRDFAAGDLKAIADIEQAVAEVPWPISQFQSSIAAGHRCTVLEHDGRVIGFTIFSLVIDEASLLNIAVHPDWLGRGCGRRLLQAGLAWLAAAGARECYLEVRVSNRIAQALYRSLDFDVVGARRAYYPTAGGREDALVMRHVLPRQHKPEQASR